MYKLLKKVKKMKKKSQEKFRFLVLLLLALYLTIFSPTIPTIGQNFIQVFAQEKSSSSNQEVEELETETEKIQEEKQEKKPEVKKKQEERNFFSWIADFFNVIFGQKEKKLAFISSDNLVVNSKINYENAESEKEVAPERKVAEKAEEEKLKIKIERKKTEISNDIASLTGFDTRVGMTKDGGDPKLITAQQCSDLKIRYPALKKAANKYSIGPLLLSPSNMGALVIAESNVCRSLKNVHGTNDLAHGVGDDTKRENFYCGHGCFQADPTSKSGIGFCSSVGNAVPLDQKLKTETNTFGIEYHTWSIFDGKRNGTDTAAAAHLVQIKQWSDKIVLDKLNKAGLPTQTDKEGRFLNPITAKAALQLYFASYNAGPTGMEKRCSVDSSGNIDGSCNYHKDYSHLIMKRSEAIANFCFAGMEK